MKAPFDIIKAQAGHPLITATGCAVRYLGLIPNLTGEFMILVGVIWAGADQVFLVNKAGIPAVPLDWPQVFIDEPEEAKPKPIEVQGLPFLCMVRSADKIPVQVTAFCHADQSLLIPHVSPLGHIMYAWLTIRACCDAKLEWCDARQPQREAVWRPFETIEISYSTDVGRIR
jgi:hypothetical protein